MGTSDYPPTALLIPHNGAVTPKDLPPTLRTSRLTLRGLQPGDADAVLDLYSRPEVQRWIGRGVVMEDLAEARELVARRRAAELPDPMGVWAIDIEDRLVGMLLLKPIPVTGTPLAADPRNPDLLLMSHEVEIGWHLHPDAWGSGLATEAASRVLDHAREHGLGQVVAVTHPDNLASQRLATRIGMVDRGPTDRYYDTTTHLFTLDLT